MTIKTTWQRFCIKEICESIIDCVNKTAPVVEFKTPYKMIRTTNVKSGWVNLLEVRYVTKETYQNWTRRSAPKQGDVILTREAPLGEVGMLRSNDLVFLGQRLVQYRANLKRLDNRFLLYAFQEADLQGQIRSFGSGSTVEHMRVPDCEKLTLRLPPLKTQKRIADILSAYDDLIENNTRRIKILEEMAQLLYREWFVNFRFPGHEDVKLVESAIGLIPEGWEVKTIGDVTSYINRGIAPKYDDQSEHIVINQKCIRNGRLTLDLSRRHVKKIPPEKVIHFGDILVNSTGIGTLGRIAQVYQKLSNCSVDSHVSIVRPSDLVNCDYFGWSLLQLQECFENMGTGSTGQTELSRQSIGETVFLLPPRVIQDKFGDQLSPIRHLITNLTIKNKHLRQTRDLLLPKLISGEIDVEDLDLGRLEMGESIAA